MPPTQPARSAPSPAQRWPLPAVLVVCALAAWAGFHFGQRASSAGAGTPRALIAGNTTAANSAGENATTPVEPTPGRSWNDRWGDARSRAANPTRTHELAALLEELARTDPQRALAFAAADENWRLRDLLRAAALRGWASVAPDAAGDFAMSLRIEDRRAAVAAVLQGAAGTPAETVRLALKFCRADPEPAGDYGHAAVAALVEVGAFDEAVRFGREVGPEQHPYLLKSAFFQWSRNDPTKALAACDALEDPALRGKARGEVLSGWAWADAHGLAEHALTLPAGEERTGALTEALPLWLEREPDAAMTWLGTHDNGPEFDAGIAAMAHQQDFIVRQPATAMGLATDISDARLRTHTMRAVFRQWATADPAAARAYATAVRKPTDRAVLLAEFDDLIP